MERLYRDNTLVIYLIIYAERLVGFERLEGVEPCSGIRASPRPLPKESLFLAGYRLISSDKGRFGTCFPSLELILPETAGELNCPVHRQGKHCAIALIGKTGSSIHFPHDKIR